jgi:hypothetical protein
MDIIPSPAKVVKGKKPNSLDDNDDDLHGNDGGVDAVQEAQRVDQSHSLPVVSHKVSALSVFIGCSLYYVVNVCCFL